MATVSSERLQTQYNNFENGIPPDVAIWMQDNSVNNGIDEIIERGIKYVKDGN
jgi:hypothetical protein